MNNKQKSLITGSLLGDGYFVRYKKHPTWNWNFGKKQSRLDKDGVSKLDYITYHNDILSSFIVGHISEFKRKSHFICTNKCITPVTYGYSYITRVHKEFTELGNKWYDLRQDKIRKIVPSNIELDPLSLCIWYMDDGTKEKGQNRCWFCTNGFTDTEVELLMWHLRTTFSIESKMKHTNLQQPMIEIGGHENCLKFYNVIEPMIDWKCFAHKTEPLVRPVTLSGESHPQSKLTLSQAKEALELYASGTTQTEIAAKYGVKRNTLSSMMNGSSWKEQPIDRSKLPKPSRGERNPNAKLTETQVKEIISLRGKMSYSKLATKYGVTKGLISHIMNKRCWLELQNNG